MHLVVAVEDDVFQDPIHVVFIIKIQCQNKYVCRCIKVSILILVVNVSMFHLNVFVISMSISICTLKEILNIHEKKYLLLLVYTQFLFY